MDNIHDFEIKDESGDDGVVVTLYCRGLPRAQLVQEWGRLIVRQLVVGPMPLEDFRVYSHGLIELLIFAEGVKIYERKTKRKAKRKTKGRRH